jgi:hypothetical protein
VIAKNLRVVVVDHCKTGESKWVRKGWISVIIRLASGSAGLRVITAATTPRPPTEGKEAGFPYTAITAPLRSKRQRG